MAEKRLREAAKAVVTSWRLHPDACSDCNLGIEALRTALEEPKMADRRQMNPGIAAELMPTDDWQKRSGMDRRKVERRDPVRYRLVGEAWSRVSNCAEKRIATEDRRKGKDQMAEPERKKLEELLSTLCVGAFAVPIEEVARRIDALYRPAPSEGHAEPCYYCGELCNSVAGDPSLWPIALSHPDDPGFVKYQHAGCVIERLHPAPDAAEWKALLIDALDYVEEGLQRTRLLKKAREMGLKVEERDGK